jgi:hypothetical protein
MSTATYNMNSRAVIVVRTSPSQGSISLAFDEGTDKGYVFGCPSSNFPDNVKLGDRFEMVTYFKVFGGGKSIQTSKETFE